MATRTKRQYVNPGDAFGVQIKHAGSGAVVLLSGELDLATAPALIDELDQVAEATTITFDLTELRFLDCHGVGTMLRAARGGLRPLTFRNVPQRTSRMLAALDLEHLLISGGEAA